MVRGIFLAKIFFTDLSEYKIRPVLVFKDLDEDVICFQISTRFKKERIIITNDDLEDGKLKKESVVIVPKNFTINKNILIKKIGVLKKDKFKEVFNLFCEKIECIKELK
ncbi:MAG: type II toxin-antitoxin system PemK/MazF family toxin [Epsilonproteobacteria bacterium]|nr:type II toxin-antitoxin system PemK/MazF family toxin [Campylobacterota bacterium]